VSDKLVCLKIIFQLQYTNYSSSAYVPHISRDILRFQEIKQPQLSSKATHINIVP